MANVGFVTVRDGKFWLNGQEFRFVGNNAYYMPTMTAFGLPAYTDDNLQIANDLNLTVLRTFAFRNGTGAAALQTAPGVYQESALRALDYVLYKADLAGVRLILPLANGQETWGGPSQYATWCGRTGPTPFYSDPACKALYKQYVAMILGRTNTYNQRVYRNDPTVFAWELANEPHLEGERTGQTIRAWVAEMAAFLKVNDPNHMVSTGEEGYDVIAYGYSAYGYSGPTTYNNQAWLFNGQKGLQWTENTRDPNVDYGSIHLYPGHWNLTRQAGKAWIAEHTALARAMGKPLVVGEFGWAPEPAGAAHEWLVAADRVGTGGALFWQLMPNVAIGMKDEFGLNYASNPPVVDVLRTWAGAVAQKPAGPNIDALAAAVEGCERRVSALGGDMADLILDAVPDLKRRLEALEAFKGRVHEVSQ